jgi:hypothetical protein
MSGRPPRAWGQAKPIMESILNSQKSGLITLAGGRLTPCTPARWLSAPGPLKGVFRNSRCSIPEVGGNVSQTRRWMKGSFLLGYGVGNVRARIGRLNIAHVFWFVKEFVRK